ncbi:ornithine carbamoyltransferase [Thermogladius calderae 1633]|uniref:Ornithine carbamoyltransferase n=1 Tax=Thermogladius calderae (strain DSM 22663 / VKM B-2946 / 1633) TaxID=1184251 RepID=I3TG98_THEC1|nr:ornithine carbamoyltransferase [Thermogladius calderae]AFK51786.1 ornithine carbamoyltransferase [Thermogladius calderae 1633]
MYSGLKNRDFLTLAEFTKEELTVMLETAAHLKLRYKMGERAIPLLPGRHLAMIFEKPSTRTRVSFEAAIKELGGDAIVLHYGEMQLARGETIEDTARTLSRYVDGIMARVYEHYKLEKLAEYSTVPVINGLSDLHHPAQGLADVFTIVEKKGRDITRLKIVFVGDGGDNVAHSLMLAVGILGGKVTISAPKGYDPHPSVVKLFNETAARYGGSFEIERDPWKAVKDADVVYTDVWVSMGQEKEREKRVKDLEPYKVTSLLMKQAKQDAIFMHCLPAHRGEEVTDEVIDGKWSVVWDQAENRKHVQKAILALLIP